MILAYVREIPSKKQVIFSHLSCPRFLRILSRYICDIAEPQYSLQYKTASTFVGAIFRFMLLRFLENLSGEYTGD